MPIYEYDCEECGRQVEILVRGSEQPVCPECSSPSLSKRLSVPATPASSNGSLPIAGGCNPSLPPCSPSCCRLPQ